MVYLQDILHEDEQNIQKIEFISKEVVKTQIALAYVSNYLLEDLYRLTRPKMTLVEGQIAVHEVLIRLLEPIDDHTITGEGNAWVEYISRPSRPT